MHQRRPMLVGLAMALALVGIACLNTAAGGAWAAPRSFPPKDLMGISCPARNDCVAIGDDRFPNVLVEHFDGSGWRRLASPRAGPLSAEDATGISCASGSACAAVGTSTTKEEGCCYDNTPQAMRWNGDPDSWRYRRVPLPATNRPARGDGVVDAPLDSVSCPGKNECMAVGGFDPASEKQEASHDFWYVPLVLRWHGGRWTPARLPLPSRRPAASQLQGVDCPSTTVCVAVGNSVSPDPNAIQPFANFSEIWRRGVWRKAAMRSPAHEPTPTLASVACRTARLCFAAGHSGSVPVVERWNGRGWQVIVNRLPAGYAMAHLASISCRTAGDCAVAGSARAARCPPATKCPEISVAGWLHRHRLVLSQLSGTGPLYAVDTPLNKIACPRMGPCVVVASNPALDRLPVSARSAHGTWQAIPFGPASYQASPPR